MIKLTDEVRIVTKKTKHNEVGDEVDHSLYIERLDDNNLVIKRGNTILNYFGDVRTCISRSLNYAVKGSSVALSIESMMQTIESMDSTIKQLRSDCIDKG